MKSLILLVTSIVCLVVSGCENATAVNAANMVNQKNEANGFPFRWQAQSVSGGTTMRLVMIDLPSGPSRADPVLQKDILDLIAKAELAKNRTNPVIEDVKLLNDGREVWLLKSTTDGIAYIVTLNPSGQGGTDIRLNGPTAYSKARN